MRRGAPLLMALLAATGAWAGEWSGHVAGEVRLFPETPRDGRQQGDGVAFSFQPQYFHSWDDGYQSFAFVPFLRVDGHDGERTHADIRELTWVRAASDWELRVGIRKVYWGVTESQHLVDIVNQTDLVESPDGEEKLGQPMVNLALVREWGTLDLFLMPGFRPRTFPGQVGRLRAGEPVEGEHASYQSAAGSHHTDWAVRWSHSVGAWDIALSHFSGTGREPSLLAATNERGEAVLRPHYEQIEQSGAEVQATLGAWLWKLEAISRDTPSGRFSALTGGFEYTLFGLAGGDADLGLLAEYSHDDRDAAVPMGGDLFVGARLTMNDTQSSELLAGAIVDLDGGGEAYSIEASRRLGTHWKASLEARTQRNLPASDPLYGLHRDAYVQIELARYF